MISKYYSPLLLFLLTLPSFSLWGQSGLPLLPLDENLEFEHLTKEDGLPSNTIGSIFQDSRGFMWFGTENGLVRYDGYELKVYKNIPNDPQSLGHNSVTAIYEDRAGMIWIGTAIGLSRYKRNDETFKTYLADDSDSLSLSDNYVFSIFEDQQGLFWIGTQSGGLNLMDRETETFRHYLPDPDYNYGFVSNAITGMVEDAARPGILWVGTMMNKNISAQFNTASRTFTFSPKPIDEGAAELSRGQINTVVKSKTNQIWLGTAAGLDIFIPEKQSFITYQHLPNDSSSLSQNYVSTIYEDPGHTIWIGTFKGGLNKFDPSSNTFSHYRHTPSDFKSLGSDNITAIFEDQSGILWVGTADAGISYVDRNAQKFATVKPYADPLDSRNRIFAIYQDRAKALWIGTPFEGLIYFAENTNELQHFREEPGDLQMLSKLWVWAILEDRHGILWGGTNRDGLFRFDREKKTLKIYKNDPEDPYSLVNNYVTAICESRNGPLWIGTTNGLQQLDRETESFRTVNLLKNGPEREIINCLYEDQAGVLWVGTFSGVFCLDSTAAILRHFSYDPQDTHSLNSNVINCITEDAGHHIWIGTNKGLGKITLAGNSLLVKRYTETDGLPSNDISGILEGTGGQIWISTTNGLSVFRNPQHDEHALPDFKTYGVKDGLQSYDFDEGIFFKNTAGELFFGGPGGFNRFHPDSIADNSFLPPVFITSFESYDMEAPEKGAVSIDGISEKREVTLSYNDNIFSIDFAALSFRESHLNKYAYQLEGFNNNWIQLGTDHQVTFTNLDPGSYIFRVKGTNNDGIWNEVPTELKIVITPPWWKTGWAYALYALGVMIAIYSWRRYDLKRRQLKHDLEIRQLEADKLKEVDTLKSRFFANISHDFRTPLTLILGPLDELIAKSPSKTYLPQFHLIQRSAQGLLRLINQLLDISKLESGKMSLEARCDDIIPLIKGSFYAFESQAKLQGIDQHFETALETAPLYFDRDKMEQIITNVLSNAFKFTAAGGTVTVRVENIDREDSPSSLQITVSDTGIGIAADQLPHVFDRFYQSPDGYAKVRQGSGIGLALVKELVELHHGRIEVSSEVGRGTQFTLLFPFGKAHLEADEIVEEVHEAALVHAAINRALPIPDVQGPIRELLPPADEEAAEEAMVLLVEDNADMRAFIRRQLAGRYRVLEASDGQEGIEKAIETIPDLIISDVMMPRMDGLQLCDALKNDERTSHIPIILLTSKADVESRLAGLDRGADAYLAKPFNREELLVRSRNLLELRRLLRARYASLLPPPPAKEKDLQIEDAFLQKTRKIVAQHLTDQEWDIDRLSQELGMSRSQVFRKIKALTGKSPSVFIRNIRLHRAKELLETTHQSVSEVAYEVGFSSLPYFSDVFLEAFGARPSELRK